MIFDETNEQYQQYGERVTALSARLDIFELLVTAQHLGIQMSFHRGVSSDGQIEEFLQWTIADDKPVRPALEWMAKHEHHDKLFNWHKMQWHVMKESRADWEDTWVN